MCNCVICLDRYFSFPFLNLFLSYIAGNISELSLNEERGNFTNHIFSSFSEKKNLSIRWTNEWQQKLKDFGFVAFFFSQIKKWTLYFQNVSNKLFIMLTHNGKF